MDKRLNSYFDRIENELRWTIKPDPSLFEGEEQEKLLEAQARGEPVKVRLMLTNRKKINETIDRLMEARE